MVTGWARTRTVVLAFALAGTGITALPTASQAQVDDARVRKIEAEIRALQRAVFPGGDGRFFTPEVLPPAQPGSTVAPASGAMTDMLVRLEAIESQLARITSQVEENTNTLAQLSMRLEPIEAERNAVLEAERQRAAAAAAAAAPQPAVAAATAQPSPERLAAVQAIAKPDTGDAGEDEYVYGFRLWEAKLYPEAQQQLRLFLDRHPRHARASFGRNLLGRAYLDDGKPREAAPFFLQNYQSDGQGARAPDSLLFLAEAMIAMEDTNRACIALAEFADTYPAIATGRLQSQYQANRARVRCN